MCGIAGIIKTQGALTGQEIRPMLDCLKHRGPDDEGVWVGAKNEVVLGQRRLAIIDLSAGGHQPKVSEDGRYCLTFNGEIYNYRELREELISLGIKFTTASDTEVLLQAFIRWGEACLQKLNGMFAFAVWDEKTRTLFAARDQLGEKPFKYFCTTNTFIFASEVKAILSQPDVPRIVDWAAIDVALGLRFVPAPATGFKEIKKLAAGHCLTWCDGKITIKQYWNPATIVVDTQTQTAGWKKELWGLFVDSVEKRLVSDVPVGAFLSGGLDSTSVVAAVREVRSEPIDTFVISIGGKSADQEYAALAAKHFGTRHHELSLGTVDYPSVLTRLAYHYDEPFFDASALPTMLITEAMKNHATVVLSGDGADELFGGYSAYQNTAWFRAYGMIPQSLRHGLTNVLGINKSAQYRAEILGLGWPANYAEYYSLWKTHLPLSEKYLTKFDLYQASLQPLIKESVTTALFSNWLKTAQSDSAQQAMVADLVGRLADGYLTKIDLAAMANAVEVRPPFLDHRLVERAVQLPSSYKLPNGGKSLWKEIVREYIPDQILNRPKVGFSVPLDELLRTDFSGSIRDVLLDPGAKLYEHFEYKVVQQLWLDHQERRADYSNHLWSLLMLELWLRQYLS